MKWKLALLGLAISSIWFFDAPIAKFCMELPGKLRIPLHLFSALATPGFHLFLASTLLAISLSGFALKNKRSPILHYFMTVALLFSLCYLLKVSLGRARPYLLVHEGVSGFFFNGFHDHFRSFPSSHAAFAFALAVFFARIGGKSPLLWISALFLAFARVALNKHFLSDIVVGGLLGYEVALFVQRRLLIAFEKKKLGE